MKNKHSDRILWIDIAKGIAMLLIINVHFPEKSGPFPWGQGFHVVVFFLLSGFLMKQKNDISKSPHEISYRKWRKLGYPYLTFSFVLICTRIIMQVICGKGFIKHSISNLMSVLTGKGIGTLWFLSTLAVAEFLVYLLIRKFSFRIGCVAGLLSLACGVIAGYITTRLGVTGNVWINIDNMHSIFLMGSQYIIIFVIRSLIAAGFITVGYLIAVGYQNIQEKKRLLNIFIVTGLVLGVVYIIRLYPYLLGNDLNNVKIVKPVGYILGCLSAAYAVLCVSVVMQYIPLICSLLAWIGRHSIIIMTTHYDLGITSAVCNFVVRSGLTFEMHPHLYGTLSYLIILGIEVVCIWCVKHSCLRLLYEVPGKKETQNGKN